MPLRLGILPEDIFTTSCAQIEDGTTSAPWRFVRLPHPRNGLPSLFYLAGNGEVLEVQAVSPPSRRSWLVDHSVVADGKLFTMIPIDPAFLLIPFLKLIAPDSGSSPFRTAEDLLEECATRLRETPDGVHLAEADISRFLNMCCSESALHRICETKDVSSLTVFRYSLPRILSYLQEKVDHLAVAPVPDMSRSITRNLAKDGLFDDSKEELLKAARLRVACDLISHYISPELLSSVTAQYDFVSLETYLNRLHYQETQIGAPKDSQSEKAEPEKKRKAAKGSHGVEKLKKANVKGMSKLSTFFAKKT